MNKKLEIKGKEYIIISWDNSLIFEGLLTVQDVHSDLYQLMLSHFDYRGIVRPKKDIVFDSTVDKVTLLHCRVVEYDARGLATIAYDYQEGELSVEAVDTYSIISVRGVNTDGTIEGFWVQDKIGTLTEAKELAKSYTIAERNEYVVVDGVSSITPQLSYFTNLKRII